MQALRAPRRIHRKVIAVSGEFTLKYNYHIYHLPQMTNSLYIPQKMKAMMEWMAKTITTITITKALMKMMAPMRY